MAKEEETTTSELPPRAPPSKSNIALARRLCKSKLGLETCEDGSNVTLGSSGADLIQLRDIHGGTRFIVKVPQMSSDLSSIQRCGEEGCRAQWAGERGLGPKVHFVDLDTGAFAMQRLEAKSLTSAEIVERLPEVMALLHRFHSQDVPDWASNWNIFDYARKDLAVAKEGTLLNTEDFELIERVLDRAAHVVKPGQCLKVCHNDYWSTNILSDREGRLSCVDFEVTGRGDPLWDIGYLASELQISAREVAMAYGLCDDHDQLQVVAYRHAAKAWLAAWCGTQSDSWSEFLRECIEQTREADGQENW